MAAMGVTYPAAGVIATRPATAPETNPSELGLPPWAHETSSHAIAATAVAVLVVTKALTARPFAATALPALNPNQPNHRSTAPRIDHGILAGSIAYLPYPTRLPITSAKASAAKPELIWTTVPPAKTIVVQIRAKTRYELNFIRSAKPDVTIAIVTVANTSWKTMYSIPGINALYGPGAFMLTPFKPRLLRFPTNPPISGPKASEYPISTHWMLTSAKATNE